MENLLFVLKPTEQNSSGAGWRASLPRSHCGYWRAGWAASGGRGGGERILGSTGRWGASWSFTTATTTVYLHSQLQMLLHLEKYKSEVAKSVNLQFLYQLIYFLMKMFRK